LSDVTLQGAGRRCGAFGIVKVIDGDPAARGGTMARTARLSIPAPPVRRSC